MRAVVLTEFGPPENLTVTDVPEPVPGQGEVLVEVEIASITFVETQIRAGRAPNPAMLPALPAILGNGVRGTVQGQPVVQASLPVPVPAGLSLADAVALLADGRTALGLIRAAALRPGETVLVEAAAGGVGSLLVQLAREAGARVIAAAGGPRKVAVAGDLGADATADYTQPGWAAELGEEVDVVCDGVGGDLARDAFGLIRDGGRMYSYGAASGAFAPVGAQDAARRTGSGRSSASGSRWKKPHGRMPRSRLVPRSARHCCW